ncbi:NAD-dependent epimerase/dehydratase family protein [Pseudoroseicyclus sp. H15]
MKLLVTGSGGFLGRAVLAAAEARGHEARGLTRADGDLAEGLAEGALEGIDAVLHCAAAMDSARAARDTVQATLALLAAMAGHPARLVLASSIAVYAAPGPRHRRPAEGEIAAEGGIVGAETAASGRAASGRLGALYAQSTRGRPPLIDEGSPLDPAPRGRDAYMRAKLAQEGAVRAEAAASGRGATLLRMGALVGPGRLWNAHLGLRAGPVLLALGGRGEVPLVHVEDAALAMLLSTERAAPGVETFNVVASDLPMRAACRRALRRAPGGPKLTIPLPWRLLDALAPVLDRVPKLGPRLPGLLRRPALRARFAPARYSNARLRAAGWEPKHSVTEP